jgi:acetyl-CoA C-acetyltransferase
MTNPTDLDPNTPILVGVGQHSEQIQDESYAGLSPVGLAAAAAAKALNDAAEAGTSSGKLAAAVDAVYAIRTVADTGPRPARRARAPFGSPDNFPGAVASRIGASAPTLVYSPACGDEPQKIAGEICERLHRGDFRMALLCGAEAASTQRSAVASGQALNWNEESDAPLDDRPWNPGATRSRHMTDHNLLMPTSVYPLLENARRRRLGMDRTAYAQRMGELMAPFSRTAAANPHAASTRQWTPEEIASVSPANRMIADPHPISVVARDLVNLGAALLFTTVGTARELGIDTAKWVFLHGYSSLEEQPVLERADLGASPAMELAYATALEAAGVRVDEISYFDLYSCFPVAVFNAVEALNLDPTDPRGLTVTGGLPFFGGPGNNYSTHAIGEMAQRLRAEPGTFGLVGANGGYMSTHAVGIYSTSPTAWRKCSSEAAQERIDRLPATPFTETPEGWAVVESYTVLHGKTGPRSAIAVARMEGTGERCVANSFDDDAEQLAALTEHDGLGQRIYIGWESGINRFARDRASLEAKLPAPSSWLARDYKHVRLSIDGHLLEITIDRPAVRNALTPEANEELADVFDAFEGDDDLWVAIITGAGTEAFCAGNDLKSSVGRTWLPRSGFGGLTHRFHREKPVIAAVNGYAMGGGFEMALAADLVVADARARFALSEPRVGLLSGAGGLQRLTRQVPYKQAMDMILTGRQVGAEEGHQLGFVSRLAPAGQALEVARQLAREVLECSPNSLRQSKRLISESERYASLEDAVGASYRATDFVVYSEDRFEGTQAFIEKRAPRWTNN